MKLLFDTPDSADVVDTDPRTREGLERMVETACHTFDRLSEPDYLALTETERTDYNAKRQSFITGQMLLNTPHMMEAKVRLLDCFAQNSSRRSGQVGLMLDGDSTLGKTTILEALIEYVYNRYAAQVPDHKALGYVPIVFVEVPAGSRGKSLMEAFADFLGLPVAPRETMNSIRKRVAQAMRQANTKLVVVDELHKLAGSSINNGESVDILKELHNEVHATFLYAGLNLTSGELLSGSRGQQLSARFSFLGMSRYSLDHPEDKVAWKALVTASVLQLPLRHQDLNTLISHSDYLLARTGGSIGSLGRLLGGAAIALILDPVTVEENITRAHLVKRTLDLTAETFFDTIRKTKAGAKFNDEN